MRFPQLSLPVILGCVSWQAFLYAESTGPIRKLIFDPAADVVELLDPKAGGKLRVRVMPQNEFRSRIVIENLTQEPLTVRLPKAVAAVHSVSEPKDNLEPRVPNANPEDTGSDQASGNGQAVVGTFGPMNGPANGFPHQSEDGNAFTIPAQRSVMIALHSACAEHGKRAPISRMTYELRPLEKQVENETLQRIIQTYDPAKTDSGAFQAVVWHLANSMSWEDLARKTIKTAGQNVPYFTRKQLVEAQQLLERAKAEE